MKKNFKMSFIALLLVIAVLLTACGKGENDLNEEITASESGSDSSDETKPETTTAEAETSFETTAAETEASTEAAASESEQSSASESEEESVSESNSITEEQTESTSESTSVTTTATTTEAAAVITAASTEAAVFESEQANVTESETVTEEEMSETEESVSKEMAALKSAVSLHELHKEEDKIIDLCIMPYQSSGGAAYDVGWTYPFDYEGEHYIYAGYYGFISDAEGNITILDKFDDWVNDFVFDFDKMEYVGMSWDVCFSGDDEADIYRYEDKLVIIYNAELYPLTTWEIRKKVYGFTDIDNNNVLCDLDKLKKVLSERSIEYDPSVFMFALVYEIDE